MNSSAFQPMLDSIAFPQEADLPPAQTNLPPTPEAQGEVAATSPATSREGSTNQPPLWQPVEPQFTKAIAQYYGVSRKSVQQWFQKVKEACPWFSESDLKLPDERYSPLCVELMGQYRTSGLPFEAWKTQIWEQNPELVAAYQAAQKIHNPSTDPSLLSSITLSPSDVPLPVYPLQPLRLTVVDSTDRLTEAINNLNTTLQQFVTNDQTLEDALKQNATQKGSRLGTELAIAEIGSMVQATESARVELAKKLGLLSIPTDPPQPQSA
ncbi:hypothetical protein [Leptolyngbya ohadii]|uniref:hypothetical protein n=1 Tax=Leptolyngbya ohadii TaxID=1962290 RepID=UPI000B59B7BA|nr:hypothetical protein [Leptolyngbya ohadii]